MKVRGSENYPMSRVALIDGDIVVYRCGFAGQRTIYTAVSKLSPNVRGIFPSKKFMREEFPMLWENEDQFEIHSHIEHMPPNLVFMMVDNVIDEILTTLDITHYTIVLSGSQNFRKEIATIQEYKGNRDPSHKPILYSELRDYLKAKHNAKVIDGIEADDWLGLNQTDSTVICSIDKDLKMIPGYHYNFVKKELEKVDEIEGLRNFYKQLLTGDPSDNVPGIPGIGDKRAGKILDGAETEEEMFFRCLRVYREHNLDHCMEEIGNLLWIMRKGRETWKSGLTEKCLKEFNLSSQDQSM